MKSHAELAELYLKNIGPLPSDHLRSGSLFSRPLSSGSLSSGSLSSGSLSTKPLPKAAPDF